MKKIILVFLLSFMSFYASSQLINVEKMRKANKEGFQGKISLSFSLRENTKSILRGANTLHIQYNSGRHTLLFLNGFSLLKIDKKQIVNRSSQHLRYNYEIRDGFTIFEFFTQHQHDEIKLLKKRFLVGSGTRFRIVDKDTVHTYLGTLLMYEYETLNTDMSDHSKKLKADYYVSAGFDVNKLLSLSHTTYYQPDVKDWSDFRISSETGCKLKISTKLAYHLIFRLEYDAKPPEDIPNLFYSLLNTLSYSF